MHVSVSLSVITVVLMAYRNFVLLSTHREASRLVFEKLDKCGLVVYHEFGKFGTQEVYGKLA